MSKKLSNHILDLLNKKVRPATLRDLKLRGLDRVSLLDLSDLNVMIEEAVSRALADMGIKLRPRELKIQSDRVREEFFRVCRERDALQETVDLLKSEFAKLKDNRGILTARVERDRKALEHEERRPVAEVTISSQRLDEIRSSLEESLRGLFFGRQLDRGLAEEAVTLTLGLIDAERQRAVREAHAAQEERVTQLKRRISNLMAKLEETERMLANIDASGAVEGMPSIYRTVQGLKKEAGFFEEKKAALEKIFQLNVELKKLIDES